MVAKYDPQQMRARLKAALDEKGLSYRAASEASGNSPSYLSGIITRGRDPQLSRLINVCNYLDISPTWVLYGFEIPDGADEIFQLLAKKPELSSSIAALLKGQLDAADQG